MSQLFVVPRTTEKWDQTFRRSGVLFCHYTTRQEYKKVRLFLTNTMVVYILEGTKVVHLPQEDLILGPGEGFIAAKGEHLFTESFPSGGTFRSLLFYFDDRVLTRILDQLEPPVGTEAPPSTGFWPFTPGEHLINLFLTFPPCFQAPASCPSAVLEGKLLEIFWHLSQTPEGPTVLANLIRAGQLSPQLQTVVEQNLHRHITLEDLARLAGRSLSAFKRDFHQAYGQPPFRWIQTRRLEEARVLLRSGEGNVTEVALRCGFENLSSFSRAYRRHWNCTPEEEKRPSRQNS